MATQTSSSNQNTGRFQKGDPRAERKRGAPNKATAEIKAVAQLHGKEAIEKLVSLMRGDDPEIAFKAANSLLDRGYGKPAQTLQGDAETPLQHNIAVVDEFTRRIASMGEKLAA